MVVLPSGIEEYKKEYKKEIYRNNFGLVMSAKIKSMDTYIAKCLLKSVKK